MVGHLGFGGGGIDDVLHLGDAVRRESSSHRVLADDVLIRSDIDTIDLVRRDVALDPLDLRPELLEYAARGLRYCLQLCRRRVADPRYLSLYDVFWHSLSS